MDILNFVFKVKTIRYRDNDSRYAIVVGKIISQDTNVTLKNEMTIKGYFPSLYVKDEFKGQGNLIFDKKNYCHYINLIDIPNIIIPENKKSLSLFISRRVNRLSPKKALEIVETLGLSALTIIENDYKMLLKVDGINEKKAQSIHNQLTNHTEFEKLALFIQGLSMPISLAVKIYDRYESESIDIIKGNPYSICYDYTIPFIDADTIAKNLNFDKNNKKRLSASILDYINYRCINNGDLCVYKDMILNNINNHLDKISIYSDNNFSQEDILLAIDELSQMKRITCELNSDNQLCIYKISNNIIENKIIDNLDFILNGYSDPFCTASDITDFIDSYEKKYAITLAKEQKEAVYMALQNKISVLTGGPGTGKTQTTNVIIQCIRAINPFAVIRPLAPTGKASTRITELTNMEASTIHRGLKLTPFTACKRLTKMACDYVIVDESSMIDAYIFEKLTSAIDENTRILFVGDVEQLPSIGAGLILRDLIESKKIPTTRLVEIFRQASHSNIVTNAHKIIAGLKTTDIGGVDISNKVGSDFIFWQEKNPAKVMENIISSINRLMTHYKIDLSEICVLSPTRKGDIGTDEINRLIQRKFNPPDKTKSEYEIDGLHLFRVGDIVMQNKNNYDLNVFNGDCGVITKIYVIVESGVEQWRIDVKYKNKEDIITYREQDFEELELAYATTIHKSQGSEYKCVIMIVHSLQYGMLYRNIIYTGVTRAKQMCILIGEETALNEAIDRTDNCVRISRVKEKIMKLKIA